MKVLLFNGSPHLTGNTAAVLNEIAAGAKGEAAEVKVINLNTLKMKGCQGCYGCQQADSTGVCVIQDDMRPLYDEIYEADAIVIGTSIYMGQMTSQTKQLLDRFFAFMRPDFTTRINNKKTVLVFVHGQVDKTLYKAYIDMTAAAFNLMGFKVIDTIIANGLYAAGMAANNAELMSQANSIGKKLGIGVE